MFSRKNKNKFLIVLGDFKNGNDVGNVDVGEMSRGVANVITHPSYNYISFDNDIALIRLESPIDFNK